MLRWIATGIIVILIVLELALPSTSLGRRGNEDQVRSDVIGVDKQIGMELPFLRMSTLSGHLVSTDKLIGHRILLIFERSVDWCPYTKARLVELRNALEATPGLRILWVMAENQINERTRAFIDEYGLRDRIYFLLDEDSQVIRRMGLLNPTLEPVEKGVPHPATYLIDREGIIRFVDVREDFHIWLAPERIVAELEKIP